MSIRVMTVVWDLDLPDSEKLIALALADWCDDQGNCWPSVAQIAQKSSKSERTVQTVTASLERKGHLTRIQIPGKGCRYRLHPNTNASLDPRKDCTPAKSARVQGTTNTPAAAAPNTSIHTNIKNTQSAHELPDDWVPAPFFPNSKSEKLTQSWPPGEWEGQIEHFTAHHRSKGSKFKNWQDAWATWVLNSTKFGGRTHANTRNSSSHRHSRRNGFLDACHEAAAAQTLDPFAPDD